MVDDRHASHGIDRAAWARRGVLEGARTVVVSEVHNLLGRNTADDGLLLDVLGDHRALPDGGSASDRNARKDGGALEDRDVVLDDDGLGEGRAPVVGADLGVDVVSRRADADVHADVDVVADLDRCVVIDGQSVFIVSM